MFYCKPHIGVMSQDQLFYDGGEFFPHRQLECMVYVIYVMTLLGHYHNQ